ncbi:hypothetical protein [Neobacillus niacini]|jgi:hypothetical protein|nr:hypothetical protein [Neobacillus niacini]
MKITDCYGLIARVGEILADKSLNDKEKVVLIGTWFGIYSERESS